MAYICQPDWLELFTIGRDNEYLIAKSLHALVAMSSALP
ncbi:hypothetical protein PSEUDO9AZ_10028 [Pseudomonas sp. 9AZ]|nr:hypothetical protein PSEUDO9AZ_10028 [Pseudomonas sp. 9AZ]